MSRTALIYSIALSLLIVNVSTAQTPTLDPAQTVNPATGEMGFALALATVKGANGHDFPINVSYGAGIRTSQEAVTTNFFVQNHMAHGKMIISQDHISFSTPIPT